MTTLLFTERWTFGGVDLSTFARLVRSTDGVDDAPPLRGDDAIFGALPGRRHLTKLEDGRRIGIAIWIQGTDDDGVVTEPTEAEQARVNLDAFQIVLGRRYQQELVRIMPDGSERVALAECIDWQAIKEHDAGSGILGGVADFWLADPWFYGDEITSADYVPASPTDFTLAHPGTVHGHRVTLDLLGPITDPRVTNQANGIYVEYDGEVAATKHLAIDCEAFTATNDGANAIGDIAHSGAYEWLRIEPGDNTIRVTGSGLSEATKLVLTFRPPYR